MDIPIIDLLEEFEYYPENESTKNRNKSFLGKMLMTVGAVSTIFFLIFVPIFFSSSVPYWFYLVGSLVSVTGLASGLFLALRFTSRERFKKINQLIETHIWSVSDAIVILVMILLLAALVVTLLIADFHNYQSVSTQDFMWGIFPMVFISLMLSVLHLGLRVGQVRLGIASNRARLRGGVVSRWADLVVSLSILVFPVLTVGVIDEGSTWIAVAIAGAVPIIGWHIARSRRFDKSVQNLVGHFNLIREQCLAKRRPVDVVDVREICKEVRALQVDLVGYPRMAARPFTFGGLLALCIVIDARARGGSERWVAFAGEKRQEAAKKVLELNDWDFTNQLGRVFDALLQQMDRGFAPGMQKVKGDLRSVYEASL